MYINHSRIKTYQNCPRKYFWNYEFDGLGGKGLQFPGVNENLLIGTMIHAGLAEMYREGMPDTYFPTLKKTLIEEYPEWEADPLEKNTWEENLKWCAQFLDDYYKNQFAKDEFTCLNIEVPFSVPLGNTEHQYVGRIDMIVNDNGRMVVYDHKTTKSSSKLYLESWHYSNQLLGYVYGASKVSGFPIRGYCVNILRKLKSVGEKRPTDRTCPDCRNGSRKKLSCEKCKGLGKVPISSEELTKQNPFQRESESVGEGDLKRWEHSRLEVVKDIEADITLFNIGCAQETKFPKNEENCFSYGRCPFLHLCWEGDPEEWFNPPMENLCQFEPRPGDYVNDIEKMQKEELK